jgi:hypothetical protein
MYICNTGIPTPFADKLVTGFELEWCLCETNIWTRADSICSRQKVWDGSNEGVGKPMLDARWRQRDVDGSPDR